MKPSVSGAICRLMIVVIFFILSVVGIAFSVYLAYSSKTMYTLMVALAFAALSVISSFFNIATAYFYYRSFFYETHLADLSKSLRPLTRFPSVAIAMPTYNEDPAMVERNMLRMRDLNYKGELRFYIADDSTKPGVAEALERMCKAKGITYLHRDNRKGFKAGALNNMLKHSKEEYIAVFDADEYLTDTNFLLDLLPYFEDKRVSFVQTEKRYAKGSFFSDSIDLFDALFFKFIQPSRALNGTAIFAGSCGLLRRSAVDSIGGFPEYIIEDTFFSFASDIHNFKSIYVPKVYALGKPIMTFTELMRQQWRYNYGDTQFLMHFLSNMRIRNKHKLSALSKIEYTTHGFGLNYLSSVLILFTVVSILVVLSSAPLALSQLEMMLSFKHIPFFSLEFLGIVSFTFSLMLPLLLTKIYFNSISKGAMIFVLNFALSFIRLEAAIAAVLGKNPAKGWIKGESLKISAKLYAALKNSAKELTFSGVLAVAGLSAYITYNISGALWLIWYSVLYSSTFFFFFKYG